MVKNITYLSKFSDKVKRLDGSYKERIKKVIQKIVENTEIGKPMMYERKGTREVYLAPHRLSYTYDIKADHLYFLNLYHKDEQ